MRVYEGKHFLIADDQSKFYGQICIKVSAMDRLSKTYAERKLPKRANPNEEYVAVYHNSVAFDYVIITNDKLIKMQNPTII